jgi:hypothetical protein
VDRWRAAAVGTIVFVVLNANGREIPSGDSQAAKYASVALARRHSLTLDGVVGRVPLFAERLAFQQDVDGHWRNAYPLPPVLEAAAAATLLRGSGVIQLDAPLAPAAIAKLTASALSALASMFAFLIARRFTGPGIATAVALGFALGTGIWPVASQTLWQHASVIWSVTAAIWLWLCGERVRNGIRYALIGLLLGWAASARPQTFPMLAILAAGMLAPATARERAACALAFALPVAIFAGLNLRWFGHIFGRIAELERHSLVSHRVDATWQWPGPGVLGLLISPSRGLLIFSPVVLVALAARIRGSGGSIVRWTLAAAGVQLLIYGSFSVWWGGHTYGPRYALDLLPSLIPAAALGASRIAAGHGAAKLAAGAALAWSILAAATGAFCYPHDRWNTDPVSADIVHERLWDFRDTQIRRCWTEGLSPQNFALFDRAAWRR